MKMYSSLNYLISLILSLTLIKITYGQIRNSENSLNIISKLCHCMDYWQCLDDLNGEPYTYCKYSNQVCCLTNSTVTSTSLSSKSKTSTCGRKGSDLEREGIAEAGEWGWHIAILESPDLYICGGSLIDENFVITAAHCVDNYAKPELLTVRVGEYDVTSMNEPERHDEYSVSRIFIHFNFKNQSLENDIAILKLKSSVKKKPNINIVCLPENIQLSATLLDEKCYITGWGRKSEKEDHSKVLKEVRVPLWNHKRCESALKLHFGANFRLPNTTICGGDLKQDACEGDGGGGLFCVKNDLWYQMGVISFGVGCGRRNSPGVYTKVSSYLNWIHKIVTENSR